MYYFLSSWEWVTHAWTAVSRALFRIVVSDCFCGMMCWQQQKLYRTTYLCRQLNEVMERAVNDLAIAWIWRYIKCNWKGLRYIQVTVKFHTRTNITDFFTPTPLHDYGIFLKIVTSSKDHLKFYLHCYQLHINMINKTIIMSKLLLYKYLQFFLQRFLKYFCFF